MKINPPRKCQRTQYAMGFIILTFGVDKSGDPQLLLGHIDGRSEVLQRLLWVAVIVVEDVGPMAVDDGTQSQPVPPAGVEVGDLNLLVAGERNQT